MKWIAATPATVGVAAIFLYAQCLGIFDADGAWEFTVQFFIGLEGNEMAMIRVGRKHERGAQYIGRGSPLGNPFKIGRDGDRDDVCDAYRDWFEDQITNNNPTVLNELRRLYRIARDEGELVLGCFCSPQRCHGDTIKHFLEEQLEQITKR